jgi:hypothetical protein
MTVDTVHTIESNGDVFIAEIDWIGPLLAITTRKTRGWKKAHKLMAASYQRYDRVTYTKAYGEAISIWKV